MREFLPYGITPPPPGAYPEGGAKGPWPPLKSEKGGPKYHMAPPKLISTKSMQPQKSLGPHIYR